MDKQQFYPTPSAVVYRMLGGIDIRGKKVLDPSAGQGAILDVVRSMGDRYRGSNTYAIEIDTNNQAVLRDKGHKVIDSDFLQHSGQWAFDFILMNPPFNDGVAHLLKAWEISKGAVIKCLLNAETIKNDFTQNRKRLKKIIGQYGQIDELGTPFKNAPRSANVEVILVTLQDTDYRKPFQLEFEAQTVNPNGFNPESLDENALASYDIFENYESRFMAALAAFEDLLAARQRVDHYLKPLLGTHKDPVKEALAAKDSLADVYDTFLELSTRYAWDMLFRKTKLGNITTQAVRDQIEEQQKEQAQMAFTANNMQDLFYMLIASKDTIMLECVLEVFDNLTKYHDENREYVEGWKTNSAYLVGKRFILPNIKDSWNDGIDYRKRQEIGDIERACCFLTGKQLEQITSINSLYEAGGWRFGQWLRSEFFDVRLYKKGTMHFRWLDEALRQDFNTIVAKHRWGFLPEKVKKGAYK